jgi:hypothetical protein
MFKYRATLRSGAVVTRKTMAALAAEYEVGEATIWRALQPAISVLLQAQAQRRRRISGCAVPCPGRLPKASP